MVNTEDKLRENFGNFKARLADLENIDPADTIPDPSGKLYLKDALKSLLFYPPENVLPFVGGLIEHISSLCKEDIERKKCIEKYYNENESSLRLNNIFGIYDPKALAEEYINLISEELKSYENQLLKINEKLNDELNRDGESTKSDKLTFNISIDHLAALFRIFLDSEIIANTKTHTEIIRQMSIHLSSVKKGDLSTGRLQKLFSSPEPKSLEYWQDKFIELRNLTVSKQKKLNDKYN